MTVSDHKIHLLKGLQLTWFSQFGIKWVKYCKAHYVETEQGGNVSWEKREQDSKRKEERTLTVREQVEEEESVGVAEEPQ